MRIIVKDEAGCRVILDNISVMRYSPNPSAGDARIPCRGMISINAGRDWYRIISRTGEITVQQYESIVDAIMQKERIQLADKFVVR